MDLAGGVVDPIGRAQPLGLALPCRLEGEHGFDLATSFYTSLSIWQKVNKKEKIDKKITFFQEFLLTLKISCKIRPVFWKISQRKVL